MGRKRKHKKKIPRPHAPKAKLEGLSINALQKLLWQDKPYSKVFESFSKSKHLMRIFKLLVFTPAVWNEGLIYDTLNPKEKLDLIFGVDYRHIYTYKVMDDFILSSGVHKDFELAMTNQEIKEIRHVFKGETVLLRVDTRDEEMKVEVQVLSRGLFQDTSEDHRSFIIDTDDIKHFRKYLKLVDSDGVAEESFI